MKLRWILPSNRRADRPNFILIHGFGANPEDMRGLAIASDALYPAFNWFFPQASVEVTLGSYAWFPSIREELDRVMQGDFFDEIELRDMPEIGLRSRDILEDVDELGIDWSNTVVGGFSQGSMMALRSLLELGSHSAGGLREQGETSTQKKLPKGLVLLSSFLIDRTATEKLIASCPHVPVFQSHGSADSVLPIQSAQNLRDIFVQNRWPIEYHTFAGEHTITDEIINKYTRFVQGLFV